MTNYSVSGLSIYPVKSCREIKLESSSVESFGLEHDRRWMVVDENGEMLTQRKIAEMCLIHVELTKSGLTLSNPFVDKIYVAIPTSKNKVTVKVWQDYCQAYDAGDAIAKWLSAALSQKCRLVYFPDDEFRQVDLTYANEGDKTAFSDGFPLLLVSQASLDDLNARLKTPVTMARFRPNIIISGCQPFEEDNWKTIQIGEVVLRIVKPCSRCIIPNINIKNANKEQEPIKTLSIYRKRENKIFFGQNVIATRYGKINVGMEVKIIE